MSKIKIIALIAATSVTSANVYAGACIMESTTINGYTQTHSQGDCSNVSSSFGSTASPIPVTPRFKYSSTYDAITWVPIADTYYCLDITDTNYNIFPGFQALQCGGAVDFYAFSPSRYVQNVMQTVLPSGYKFGWRIWQRAANGDIHYGGKDYEGLVTVP